MEHVHDRWDPERAIGKVQYPRDNVSWVYVSGYYDGPISGRVILRSPRGKFDSSAETLWAQIFEECNETEESLTDTLEVAYRPVCGFYRKYLLYRLNPESAAEEQRRHELFEKHVGTHWSYNVEGQRQHSGLKPQSEWHKYYDQAKNWPTWKPEGEVVGWFEH